MIMHTNIYCYLFLSAFLMLSINLGCEEDQSTPPLSKIEMMNSDLGIASNRSDQMSNDQELSDQFVNSPEAEAIWNEIRAEIDHATPDELVVLIGDQNRIRFSHAKGAAIDKTYPIASASKMLTAMIILKLVELDYLKLSDHPQTYLDWWTQDVQDTRSQITLEQLLSFTSGFAGGTGLLPGDESIACIEDESTTIDICAQEIYNEHFTFEPGTTFFYGPSHMQIAVAMAVEATNIRWEEIVRQVLSEPLELSNTSYIIPSISNPRASGGAVSNAVDYAKVLKATLAGEFLSAEMISELTRVRTSNDVTLERIPQTARDYGDWRYALGCWRECDEEIYNPRCDDIGIISSPGAFGFYPWIDQANGYWGVLATRIRVRGAATTVPLAKEWYEKAKQAMSL